MCVHTKIDNEILTEINIYIQSAFAIPNKEKMEQEQNPLININDSFKKIIVVKEDINLWRNEEGTLIISLEDFLLNPNSLDL